MHPHGETRKIADSFPTPRGNRAWPNAKRVYRVMKVHGLLLQRHTGAIDNRRHDGRVAVAQSNLRWCSDGFELDASKSSMRGRLMARSRFIYTLSQVAGMIGENLELIEEVTANPDNISEGELVYVSDGSEDGTKGLTGNGIEELQSLLADIRTWDGGIREFLIDTQCDSEIIDCVMADEMKHGS